EEIEPAVIVVVAQGNAHSSHHASTSGQTHPGDRSNLIELAVALVVVKKRVQSIVGHEQIGPAVVVVVSRPHGKILALRIVDSHGLRYVCESAIAVVVVENVGSTFVSGRGTTRAHAANDAVPRTIRPYVDVAPNVEIEPAVAVVIKKSGAGMKERPEFRSRHAGLVGNICERTVAVVVIENVSTVLSDVKIGKSVVVVITPNATEAVARAGNSRCFGNICEGAIPIVSIKRVAHRNGAVIEIAAVHKVDVWKTVAVEICQANTRAKDL